MEKKANIAEIFYSLQGEGPECGTPYVFVRFTGCNICCRYCDTVWANIPAGSARIIMPGTETAVQIPNPITERDFLKIVSQFDTKRMCFTGGEPMLHSEFIESIMGRLDGVRLLMETNGTLAERITDRLVERIEVWSVDIKLPSVSGESVVEMNRQFLLRLKDAKQTVIKAVFSDYTPSSELQTAYEIAKEYFSFNKNITLVFQPVSGESGIHLGENYREVFDILTGCPFEARLLPQVHKVLKIL
ncbi:MAG: hypothetical protein A2Y33_02160 [Spirochaetes bacterium GWF1_51_8]|nr:MAG: hypothetical protein A2Y33_02160 [Spirochaetes bacterium GWF1_51_8]